MIDVVCGLIQNAAGEFLVCQRPVGKHLAGLWEFPGGKVEKDEDPIKALIRELEEELKITVEVGDALKPVVWCYPNTEILLKPYYCRILSGYPTAIEHQAIRWCASDEFSSLVWAPADEPILKEIRILGSYSDE